MFCSKCGNDIKEANIRFCPVCGERISQMEVDREGGQLRTPSNEIKENMDESCKNMNNSSENEIVEETQQPKQQDDWKSEMKREYGKIKEELDNDPDIPKSTGGRIVYFALGLVMLIGLIWGGHKLIIHFFGFEQPSDSKVIEYAKNRGDEFRWTHQYSVATEDASVNFLKKEELTETDNDGRQPGTWYTYNVTIPYYIYMESGNAYNIEAIFYVSVSEGLIFTKLKDCTVPDEYWDEIFSSDTEVADRWISSLLLSE